LKVDYKELGWWLEPGAKEFVKALEEQWFYNKIDTVKLYADYNFKDYLKDKYWSDAVDKAEADGALKDYSVEPNPEDYDDIDDYIEAKKDYDSVSLDN
jgi:hypothetical protein